MFPFVRFPGVDTILGPEMKSTGEVMGGSDNFGVAFAKAQLSVGQRLPEGGTAFVSQAKLAHAHHSAQITSRPRPNPPQVACSSQSVVTCVNANTNTRSKKSSTVETRCSLSARRLLTERG